jgi:hypothetical protein
MQLRVRLRLENHGATNVAPTHNPPTPLSKKRRPHFKYINGLGMNKYLVVSPDMAWNQEQLCWWQPAAIYCQAMLKLKTPVAWVRERTIPTKRLLVSEVSAKFCELEGATWSVWQIPYGHTLGSDWAKHAILIQVVHCLRLVLSNGPKTVKCLPNFHLRMETDPASGKLYSLEQRIMGLA